MCDCFQSLQVCVYSIYAISNMVRSTAAQVHWLALQDTWAAALRAATNTRKSGKATQRCHSAVSSQANIAQTITLHSPNHG